jgi:hypothetical protein
VIAQVGSTVATVEDTTAGASIVGPAMRVRYVTPARSNTMSIALANAQAIIEDSPIKIRVTTGEFHEICC